MVWREMDGVHEQLICEHSWGRRVPESADPPQNRMRESYHDGSDQGVQRASDARSAQSHPTNDNKKKHPDLKLWMCNQERRVHLATVVRRVAPRVRAAIFVQE